MFERFTDQSRRIIVLAQENARELDYNWIGIEHLILAMLDEGEGIAAQVLLAEGADKEAMRQGIAITSPNIPPGGHLPFTPEVKRCLEMSLREALKLRHNYIGSEHLLLAICRRHQTEQIGLLISAGLSAEALRLGVLRKVEEQDDAIAARVRTYRRPVPTYASVEAQWIVRCARCNLERVYTQEENADEAVLFHRCPDLQYPA